MNFFSKTNKKQEKHLHQKKKKLALMMKLWTDSV